MLVGRKAIADYLATGAIVCNPAPATIEAVHIDLHLGGSFWVPRKELKNTGLSIANADPRDVFELIERKQAIVLRPGGFALAHTDEYAGTTVPWLCPFIETRSTMARWGIAAHVSAGWGDPGFCGRWTLELYNHQQFAVAIPIGARICSIGFHRVEDNDVLYTGRYNAPEAWEPSMMLPRQGNL